MPIDKPSTPPNKSDEQSIFREISLERLANPEQLDSPLVIVTSKTWIGLSCITGLLFMILLWALFGSIPITAKGKGVMINEKGFFMVETKLTGVVKNLYAHEGEFEPEGALLAEIFNSEIEIELKGSQSAIQELKKDLEILKKTVAEEIETQTNSLQAQINIKEFSRKELIKSIDDLKLNLEKQKVLFSKGLISANAFEKEEYDLSEKETALSLLQVDLNDLQYQLPPISHYRSSDIKKMEEDLSDAIEKNRTLEITHSYSQVYSPSDGNILEVLSTVDDQVAEGNPLFWMEHATPHQKSHTLFTGFFPVASGKRILTHTRVQIELATVDPQEYGYLLGEVISVSEYPVSKDSIAQMIHNPELINYLTSETDGAIQVMVEPLMDPMNPEAYLWSSSKQPP